MLRAFKGAFKDLGEMQFQTFYLISICTKRLPAEQTYQIHNN